MIDLYEKGIPVTEKTYMQASLARSKWTPQLGCAAIAGAFVLMCFGKIGLCTGLSALIVFFTWSKESSQVDLPPEKIKPIKRLRLNYEPYYKRAAGIILAAVTSFMILRLHLDDEYLEAKIIFIWAFFMGYILFVGILSIILHEILIKIAVRKRKKRCTYEMTAHVIGVPGGEKYNNDPDNANSEYGVNMTNMMMGRKEYSYQYGPYEYRFWDQGEIFTGIERTIFIDPDHPEFCYDEGWKSKLSIMRG